MDYSLRLRKVNDLLSEQGLDALIFCNPQNIRYLCGFTGTDGVLVATREQTVFLTDSRYTTQAREQVIADLTVEYRIKVDGLIGYLSECGATRIGFENDLAYGDVMQFQSKGGADWSWRGLKDEVNKLRLLKESVEIALMEKAAALNAEAFAEIRPMLRPGAMEREIALALEFALKKRGAEEKAFDFIVASGPRGAMPHGVASERCLVTGDLVTIDFGCRLDGYHSDETVTIALGEVSPALRKIHDVVLDAHDRALAAVRPGIPLVELDGIARSAIADAGYGDYFGHGLGHGVGLDVHEAPVLSPRAQAIAEPGMVFTIEPGIYIPELGGVRIEDMVAVTDDGARTITAIPKTFTDILVD